jgi:hypothetical protein
MADFERKTAMWRPSDAPHGARTSLLNSQCFETHMTEQCASLLPAEIL